MIISVVVGATVLPEHQALLQPQPLTDLLRVRTNLHEG
jgi:hypothetical protein